MFSLLFLFYDLFLEQAVYFPLAVTQKLAQLPNSPFCKGGYRGI
jgi:hypothetical protein